MSVVVPSVAQSGAFADYLDLRTAVVEHVDSAKIVDRFKRLTLLAEARFDRELKFRQRIRTATLDFSGGSAVLPTDFWEMIGLFDTVGNEYIQQPTQQTTYNGYFYSMGEGELIAPGLSGSLRADYYAAIPTITGNMGGSNWLLQRYPDVYLYGVSLEAAKSLRDADLARATAELLAEAKAIASDDDERARYSRARVRVAGCTP